MKEKSFAKLLLKWNKDCNRRIMPWKGVKDAYKVWLSEIILQQTRVEQGMGYYLKFIQYFPDIQSLASAQDEEVFKLWEGLGYYNRCKNLLITSRLIVSKYGGAFPGNYDELMQLKGIGPYTAAAIASFVYDLPYAVVDGNVFRVLARYFGINTPIDTTQGKKEFSELAQRILDRDKPGIYNQALMDFGATVCKPFLPQCNHCPMKVNCSAYLAGKVNSLPIKTKSLQRKTRYLTNFVFEINGKVMVNKRTGKDIWENLYEFYNLETEKKITWDVSGIENNLKEQLGISSPQVVSISPVYSQQLTHQTIKGQFVYVKLLKIPLNLKNYNWQDLEVIYKLPFPKLMNMYLKSIEKKVFNKKRKTV